MEIRCPACGEKMRFDANDNTAKCEEYGCPYQGSWIEEEHWSRFDQSNILAFDQFRVSLEESEKKYNELFDLVKKWAGLAMSAGSYNSFVGAGDSLLKYVASHDWKKAVCDEVDRTVTSYNRTTISKIDRIKAVRNLAHLFPGGVAGTIGLGEAKMFIEAHYNDDGSRK